MYGIYSSMPQKQGQKHQGLKNLMRSTEVKTLGAIERVTLKDEIGSRKIWKQCNVKDIVLLYYETELIVSTYTKAIFTKRAREEMEEVSTTS
ncbi:hypothetical protein Trydic_g17906 [Trypoxylus dichotomus]